MLKEVRAVLCHPGVEQVEVELVCIEGDARKEFLHVPLCLGTHDIRDVGSFILLLFMPRTRIGVASRSKEPDWEQ